MPAFNAVVICADTFRADHLGCYGNPWISTPALDRLAAQGIVFEACFAEALPTIPARKAYFTGRPLFPWWEVHRYKGDGLSGQPGWHPLHEHEVTIPEILNPQGYVTGLVADTYHLFKPGMNLARGFSSWRFIRGQESDRYRAGPREALPRLASPYTGLDGADLQRSSLPRGGGTRQYLLNNQDRRAEQDYLVAKVMRTAAAWLDDVAAGARGAGAPFFLWVDCFDPHEPWDPPSAYADRYDAGYEGPEPVFALHNRWDDLPPAHRRRAKALYAGEVTLVDRWVGYLLERLEALGLADETAVFFTSDHGTILGEHGRLHKSPETLIAPETRLPLIARLPRRHRAARAGRRVPAFVQAYDLLPTVLEAMGAEAPEDLIGRSALPLLDAGGRPGDGRSPRDHVVSAYADHASYRTREWNLLTAYTGKRPTGTPRLFDLAADPGEATDVAADHPRVTRELLDRLQAIMEAPPPAPAAPPAASRV
jgi:arylsulfatase A-like enzyme